MLIIVLYPVSDVYQLIITYGIRRHWWNNRVVHFNMCCDPKNQKLLFRSQHLPTARCTKCSIYYIYDDEFMFLLPLILWQQAFIFLKVPSVSIRWQITIQRHRHFNQRLMIQWMILVYQNQLVQVILKRHHLVIFIHGMMFLIILNGKWFVLF